MRWQAVAGLFALLAFAGISAWWLSTAVRAPSPIGVDRGPAWYFGDAQLSATGPGGAILFRIAAPYITHEPTDDSALLRFPSIEWLQGETPLSITANSGRVHADRRHVSLAGNVVIIDDSTGTRFEFHSPDLEVDADRRIASTDSDVLILSAHGELSGTGLVADMNTGTIRIESAVRGRYAR